MEKDQPQLFISYGRRDAADFAEKLAEWLRSQDYKPWLDVENGIPLGSPFDIRIETGITASNFLIAVLSPWSLRPEGFCRNELLFAQAKNVPIIPIRIADVDPPIQIISLNYLDVAENPDEAFAELPALLKQVAISRTVGRRDWPCTETNGLWWTTLPQVEFDADLAYHGGSFVGRDWLFEKLGNWIAQPESRILLLTASAGIGKSAIAAQMTARLNVKGVHFCSRSNVESCQPPAWIGGLAHQLASQLPAYLNQLEKVAPQKLDNSLSLFRAVIADPLRKCAKELEIDEPWVFVVDGLDEAVATSGRDLAEILANPEINLPDWVRIIVTCRPDTSLLAMFKLDGIRRNHMDAEGGGNLRDLEQYVESFVCNSPSCALPVHEREKVNALVYRLAKGNFLFAKMTIEALFDSDPEFHLTADEIGSLPTALGGLYHAMFRKRFPNAEQYEEELLPLLDCLSVAPLGALPKDILLGACGLNKRLAQKSLRTLSQFTQETKHGLSLFHKSLSDWLKDEASSSEFSVLNENGHRLLADYCWLQYQEGTERMSEYCIRFATQHLEGANQKDKFRAISEDLQFRHRMYKLDLPKLANNLSSRVHNFYLELALKQCWEPAYNLKYEDLPEDIKLENLATGLRIPEILLETNLYIVFPNDSAECQTALLSKHEIDKVLMENLEQLAAFEHNGWMEHKIRSGWKYGSIRDDKIKTHPCLIPYNEMSENDKEKERYSITNIPEIIYSDGYSISKEPPPKI